MTLIVAAYGIFESLGLGPAIPAAGAYALLLWSMVFFIIIVVWIIYLTSSSYPPDPVRLIADILTSGLVTIVSFALVYRQFGIIDTLEAGYVANKSDYLYFSTVTFSTLGFGDFRPAPEARLLASAQAILGNLHLGLLAGATFYAVQRRVS